MSAPTKSVSITLGRDNTGKYARDRLSEGNTFRAIGSGWEGEIRGIQQET